MNNIQIVSRLHTIIHFISNIFPVGAEEYCNARYANTTWISIVWIRWDAVL